MQKTIASLFAMLARPCNINAAVWARNGVAVFVFWLMLPAVVLWAGKCALAATTFSLYIVHCLLLFYRGERSTLLVWNPLASNIVFDETYFHKSFVFLVIYLITTRLIPSTFSLSKRELPVRFYAVIYENIDLEPLVFIYAFLSQYTRLVFFCELYFA